MRWLLWLLHRLGGQTMRPDETESGVAHVAPRPVVTQFTPVEYGEMLKAEVLKTEYLPQFWLKGDDRIVPFDSSEGKREDAVKITWCNTAVCGISEWHGCYDFKGLRAAEILAFMIEHKETWHELSSQESAMGHACRGELVIAGDGTPDGQASGHVAVVAPEPEMERSNKWHMKVARLANVGKENWYGKGCNWAFRGKPRLFLYTPQA